MSKEIEILSEITSLCPICNKKKYYKSLNNMKKVKDKPCRSCTNSIIRGGNGNIFTTDLKICIYCKEYKKFTEFYFYKNRYHSCCKDCSALKSQVYHKNTFRYKKYGLTKEKFQEILISQKNKCAICNTKITNENSHIDHNHITNKVRGALCEHCNKGLGQFKDNINNLKQAIIYLETYESR